MSLHNQRFLALMNAIQQGELLRQGCVGESVAQLQSCLNLAVRTQPLQTDGNFGPKTHQAVCTFQRQCQLHIDGVVGPVTLRALLDAVAQMSPSVSQRFDRLPSPSPGSFVIKPGRVRSPFHDSSAVRIQQAEQILRAYGKWPPEPGRVYVIQIDQDSPPPDASQRERQAYIRSYSGQLAVFYADEGSLHEQQQPLRAASHPGQFTVQTASPPDVNGDGEPDIAWLRPGLYQYRTRLSDNGRFNPANPAEFRSVARDYSHDGVIDRDEAQGRYAAAGIQIHAGGATGPSSIGCQTLPPDDFGILKQAIAEANRASLPDFTYVLVRRPSDQFGANEF